MAKRKSRTKKKVTKKKCVRKKKILTLEEKARRTARRIINNMGKWQQKGEEHTRYMAGSDPWGPSADDFHDGNRKVEDCVTEAIIKGMK